MSHPQGAPEPWYTASGQKKARNSGNRSSESNSRGGKTASLFKVGAGSTLKLFYNGVVALIAATVAGGLLVTSYAERDAENGAGALLLSGLIALSVVAVAVFFLIRQVGAVASRLSNKHADESSFQVAISVARGEIRTDDGRRGPPAPEMALYQFVQQVRAYATEKSFQKNRQGDNKPETHNLLVAEPVDLLKRRWNEVIDSLNEFEIYLANDPQGMISKLIAKHPNQLVDVSQIFREVAESFDNTWRRKGINIESAIVTPLRANTNDALLRRLLVGPWRSSAYFARRGNSVLFSAKSIDGKVAARWETEGLMISEDYLQLAQNTEIPVNERIERGLTVIAPDPSSPNTLYALISFITWIDLAKACNADFSFKHTNDGFVIELRLK